MTDTNNMQELTTKKGNPFSITITQVPAETRGRNTFGAYTQVRIAHPGDGYRRDISFTTDPDSTLDDLRERINEVVDDSYATPLK